MKTIVIGAERMLSEALKEIEGLDVRIGNLTEDNAINAAVEAKINGARLVAISTAEVFSGHPPREPWAWSEMDIPRPETKKGADAFSGERIIQLLYPDNSIILRTGDLFDSHMEVPESASSDLTYNPTPVSVVAEVVRFLLCHPDVSGNVHATCEDQATPYEFAVEMARVKGGRMPKKMRSTDMSTKRNLALKKSVLNLLGYRTPNWKVALKATFMI